MHEAVYYTRVTIGDVVSHERDGGEPLTVYWCQRATIQPAGTGVLEVHMKAVNTINRATVDTPTDVHLVTDRPVFVEHMTDEGNGDD